MGHDQSSVRRWTVSLTPSPTSAQSRIPPQTLARLSTPVHQRNTFYYGLPTPQGKSRESAGVQQTFATHDNDGGSKTQAVILNIRRPPASYHAEPFSNVPFLSIGPIQFVDDPAEVPSRNEKEALALPNTQARIRRRDRIYGILLSLTGPAPPPFRAPMAVMAQHDPDSPPSINLPNIDGYSPALARQSARMNSISQDLSAEVNALRVQAPRIVFGFQPYGDFNLHRGVLEQIYDGKRARTSGPLDDVLMSPLDDVLISLRAEVQQARPTGQALQRRLPPLGTFRSHQNSSRIESRINQVDGVELEDFGSDVASSSGGGSRKKRKAAKAPRDSEMMPPPAKRPDRRSA